MSEQETPSPRRRDFLFYATGGAGAAAVGSGIWPLVNSMNPSASAQPWTFDIDVSDMQPGTEISVQFEGRPIFIRRRTAGDIAAARSTPLSELPDTHARNANRPEADASDSNRTIPPFNGEDRGEWLVVEGICTHLGCAPLGDGMGDFNARFCPCHGAHFDTAGRARQGPAPTNMAIPRAEFVDATTLALKETGRFSFQRQ